MAKNLRDRGYGNSMDGYQPKPERFHSREKTVAPGTAQVRKGQQAATNPVRDRTAYTPGVEQIRSEPEYTPRSVQTNKTPVDLHYTDTHDAYAHYGRVEHPFRQYSQEQKPGSGLSLEELKRRMDALEQALTSAYDRQNMDRSADRMREEQGSAFNQFGINDTANNEMVISDLYWQYNDLKNEYNAMLAQYLQGLR